MSATKPKESTIYDNGATGSDTMSDDLTRAKSGQGMAKAEVAEDAETKFAKSDFRHWLGKVFKIAYQEGGERKETQHYHVRIQWRGRRERFPLGIANKSKAAKKARDIYLRIVAEGWDPVLNHYKPQAPVKPRAGVVTLGDYMSAARAAAGVSPRSLEGYCRSLRRIVAGTLGMKGDKKRFGPRNGGSKAWRERIERSPLADISTARVTEWALSYVRKAGSDPAAQARRQHSFNSLLRQAKGLFATELVERLATALALPDPLPLAGVKPFKSGAGSMRYRSRIDPAALLYAARDELGGSDGRREEWKAFLLAFLCGLRKAEIDTLTWSQIDFTRGVIRIERTAHFAPKTEDAAADVDMDPELVEILRGLRAHASGDFYLESPLPPRPDARFAYYRAARTFDALNAWLRSKGITAQKALHELRKEAGSLLAKESGLFAAQLFLRHSSPQTTALHYLDKKQRLSTGLGSLLSATVQPANVTSIKESSPPPKNRRAGG
jgi:integrase